jgi:flagellar FliL protein
MMSSASAVDARPPSGQGKKKLILIAGGVLLLLALLGGAALFMLRQQSAHADADADAEEGATAPVKSARVDPKAAPVFVPLDLFTVNLADRDAERYAQIGMTLELIDPKVAEQMKVFMPAIRNHILMAIADRTAAQLMDREGKRGLALDVRRETSRALGYEVAEADGDEPVSEKAGQGEGKPRRKARRDPDAGLPVKAVHFNNFIIQ